MGPLWDRLEAMKGRVEQAQAIERFREVAERERHRAGQAASQSDVSNSRRTIDDEASANSPSGSELDRSLQSVPGLSPRYSSEGLSEPFAFEDLNGNSPGAELQRCAKIGTPEHAALVAPDKSSLAPARIEEIDPAEVREWARANGYPVGARGRLAQHILDAYALALCTDGGPNDGAGVAPSSEAPSSESPLTEASPRGPGAKSVPPPAYLVDEAWRSGRRYRMDSVGTITNVADGTPVDEYVGYDEAQRVRRSMQAIRKGGGVFKVDGSGFLVTVVDNVPCYVTTVEASDWY